MKRREYKLINRVLKILLLIIISSCDNSPVLKEIQVSYIPGYREDFLSNDCSFKNATETIKHTVITNTKDLIEIQKQLYKLKPDSSNNNIDIRITCTLIYSNDSTDLLCLGQVDGTLYKGNYYTDNLDLNYLIKQSSGYYKYFPYKILKFLPEIKKNPTRLKVLYEDPVIRKKILSDSIDLSKEEVIKIGW